MENDRAGGWGLSLILGIALWVLIATAWPKGFIAYLAILLIVAGIAYQPKR